MTARTRLWVLAISTPIIVFVLVGGYLGQAMAKDDTYQHLRVFDDVVTHVVNNYVEEVDLKQAMRGAMRGLPKRSTPTAPSSRPIWFAPSKATRAPDPRTSVSNWSVSTI